MALNPPTLPTRAPSLPSGPGGGGGGGGGGVTAGAVNVIEVAITAAAGAFTSATAIPVGSRVSEAMIVYDTAPYDGGATLAIGDGVTADKVFATADTSPTTAAAGDIDSVPQWTTWDAGTVPVVVTLGALPTVGAARAVVFFTVPLT